MINQDQFVDIQNKIRGRQRFDMQFHPEKIKDTIKILHDYQLEDQETIICIHPIKKKDTQVLLGTIAGAVYLLNMETGTISLKHKSRDRICHFMQPFIFFDLQQNPYLISFEEDILRMYNILLEKEQFICQFEREQTQALDLMYLGQIEGEDKKYDGGVYKAFLVLFPRREIVLALGRKVKVVKFE